MTPGQFFHRMTRKQAADIPLLVTCAVHVSAGKTALNEPDARATAVTVSLDRWANTPGLRRMVICDGSNFDFKPVAERLMAQNPTLEIECLAFQNDAVRVGLQGKGYGEGEIVNYALAQSRILRQSPSFAKCTGKLWVDNFTDCVAGFTGPAAFLLNGKSHVKYIDTRFYIISKEVFQAWLAQAFCKVDDAAGYYLEHAYADALSGFKSDEITMWPAPQIAGLSGTSGLNYHNSHMQRLRLTLKSLSYMIWPRKIFRNRRDV